MGSDGCTKDSQSEPGFALVSLCGLSFVFLAPFISTARASQVVTAVFAPAWCEDPLEL